MKIVSIVVVLTSLIASSLPADSYISTRFEASYPGGLVLPPDKLREDVIQGFRDMDVSERVVKKIGDWVDEIRVDMAFNANHSDDHSPPKIWGPIASLDGSTTWDINQFLLEDIIGDEFLGDYIVLSTNKVALGYQFVVRFRIVIPLEEAENQDDILVCTFKMVGEKVLSRKVDSDTAVAVPLLFLTKAHFSKPTFRESTKKIEAKQAMTDTSSVPRN
ncbi:MAG: hypothetical protein AAF984_07780 [Verrucomicrobiota bacterium]